MIERLLGEGADLPEAIACANDQSALGVVHALTQHGLDVPGDIAVTGFDDIPVARHLRPLLTTVRQPVSAMAVAAVKALIDEINGHGAPHSEYLFRPELIVRGSTAAPSEASTTR